jgi:PAS domain S-box-containing protein
MDFQPSGVVAAHLIAMIACGAVAVVLLFLLKGQSRSTFTVVMTWFGVLVFATGLLGLLGVVPLPSITSSLRVPLTAVFAIVIVWSSIALIRIFPRAVAFHDLKCLQAAAQELRESKGRFHRALDGSFCGLWEWNIDANSVWYSSRFREMLGYVTEDEFPNEVKSWISAVHPSDKRCALQALNKHLQDEEGFDVECRLRVKGGEYEWFSARGRAIRDPSGRPSLLSGSIQNINGRKVAEQSCRRRDQYLAQQQKMEALGELAGGTAHEFNNLLQAIGGQIQFADQNLPSHSSAKQDLAVAASLIKQAAQVTRQLLDFSRRRVGDVELIDLNVLVGRIAIMLRPILGETIDLQVEVNADTGPVLADSMDLQQAVTNLCINARDAMPAEGKLIVRTSSIVITQSEFERCPTGFPQHTQNLLCQCAEIE